MTGFEAFKKSAVEEVIRYFDNLDESAFDTAVALITTAESNHGRLHITGIGKPGHVAAYGASLFSSTGTPMYFLHGTEAVHGSCGQLVAGDVVICISNSGETAELKATAIAIRNNGCKIIGITGSPTSWLAQFSDVHLTAHVESEGGPLNRAPRNSVNAEMLTLQALSVILQEKKNLSPQRYVMTHPGGSLGQLRSEEIGIIQ